MQEVTKERNGPNVAGRRDTLPKARREPPVARRGAHMPRVPGGILDILPVPAFACDAEGMLIWFNGGAVDLWGRAPRLGQSCETLTGSTEGPTTAAAAVPHSPATTLALRTGERVRGVESEFVHPDGSVAVAAVYVQPVKDEAGHILGAVVTLEDQTALHRAHADQTSLLRELNHRVKNNMQMMLSLLSAAVRETHSSEARSALAEAGGRVAVIGAAHQALYGGETTGATYAAEPLMRSVARIVENAASQEIRIAVLPTAAVLSNDTAAPLALMINELLVGAARRAGAVGRRADVTLALEREHDHYAVTVADDGPGFTTAAERVRGAGLGLVEALARQLGGSLAIESSQGPQGGEGGAVCTIRFRDRPLG